MKKNKIIFIILLSFIAIKLNSQHLSLKTNLLNPVFVYPNLDAEMQLNKKHSIGFHSSFGKYNLYKNKSKPYYKFSTFTFDYFYTFFNSQKNNYSIRGLLYSGIIERKIYQDEKIKEMGWMTIKTRTGRDFEGKALRYGIGVSQLFKLNNRINFENNVGFGMGKYYFSIDKFYSDENNNSKYYFDFRFAMNLYIQLF